MGRSEVSGAATVCLDGDDLRVRESGHRAFLGWAVVDERIGALTLVSAVVIVGAVAVVLRREAGATRRRLRVTDETETAARPASARAPLVRREKQIPTDTCPVPGIRA